MLLYIFLSIKGGIRKLVGLIVPGIQLPTHKIKLNTLKTCIGFKNCRVHRCMAMMYFQFVQLQGHITSTKYKRFHFRYQPRICNITVTKRSAILQCTLLSG